MTVATKVIQSLIPVDSPNHAAIIEKVEAIKSHPDNLSLNKELGKSILEMVQTDDTIEEKYKLMIKNQLSIIVNGGQASIPPTETKNDKLKKMFVFNGKEKYVKPKKKEGEAK